MTQKEKIMKNLRCTAEDADRILAEDKRIDRGEVMDWDLSDEEHKKAMKNANVDEKKRKKPMALNLDATGKKKKENPTKAGIIKFLAENLALFDGISALLVTNPERQISFSLAGNDFELTLTQKRKKKE